MLSAQSFPVSFVNRNKPLLEPQQFHDTKDPCPVFDGKYWHLYGSGGTSGAEVWRILHAIAPSLEGPWEELEPTILDGVSGDHVAAPGVVRDSKEELFHMFVQQDFMATGGGVEHLTSVDGHRFKRFDTCLQCIEGSGEAGIYDPHPAEINGNKYITYAGSGSFSFTGTYYIGRPDIYLAKSISGSWYGPWERIGKIISHEDVSSHHNQLNDPDYEWGLEGPQLIALPNGKILLAAVCFLPGIERGKRQRVFFAIADKVEGPYRTLGPIINPQDEHWQSGETGHAAGIIKDEKLLFFYQARSQHTPWRYGMATVDIPTFLALLERQ